MSDDRTLDEMLDDAERCIESIPVPDIPTAARELQAAILDTHRRLGMWSVGKCDDLKLLALHAACDAMDAACVAVETALGVEPYEIKREDMLLSDGETCLPIGTLAFEADAWFEALYDYVESAGDPDAPQFYHDDVLAALLRDLRNRTARVRESVR